MEPSFSVSRKMKLRYKNTICFILVSTIVLGNVFLVPSWFSPDKTKLAEEMVKSDDKTSPGDKTSPDDKTSLAYSKGTLQYASPAFRQAHLKLDRTQAPTPTLPAQHEPVEKEVLEADDYKLFFENAKKENLNDVFLQQHKYSFNLNDVPECRGDVFLVIIVHSAPDKYKERQNIRDTWASVRSYGGAKIVHAFLIGQPVVKYGSDDIQSKILEESRRYRDIVQGNPVDSYRNLTYKNVMGLHWVKNFCNRTKFVLKTDDDTMVDVFHLINFLLEQSPDGDLENFLYCSLFRNQGPVRHLLDKWYVPITEYPYKKYPPYCEGFAYVMSRDVVSKLYNHTSSVPFYWIDDVYVTGFLALKAEIEQKNFIPHNGYSLMQSEHLSKTVRASIFLLAKYRGMRQHWFQAWNDILSITAT